MHISGTFKYTYYSLRELMDGRIPSIRQGLEEYKVGALFSGFMYTAVMAISQISPLIKNAYKNNGKSGNKSGSNPEKQLLSDSQNTSNSGLEGISKTNWNSKELLDELANSGVKYNPDDLVAVTKTPDGKLVWLENGNSQAGLNHVMNHADDFAKKGIAKDEITDLVMKALNKGEIVGYQGKGTGRPIYKVTFNGETQGVAITVGSNGFIVGANPKSLP